MSDDETEKPILLHGTLDLNVLGARSLPNMDLMSERVRRVFSVFNVCKAPSKSEGKSSHHRSKIITSDPYVTVCLGGATVARTRVINNSQEPVWNEHFKIGIAHFVSKIEFHVKDNDMFGAELIGSANVNAELLKSGEPVSDWFPVYGQYGKTHKPDSAIKLEMRFVSCENNPLYMYGMATNPDNFGVRESYFPVRRGGSVMLYQDAHVPKGMLPEIELDDSKVFKQEPCWEDICHAILEAHHMVYVVGWSIYDKIKLVREATKPLPSGGDLTLGELLKYKSQEGVRVLMLVWDDKTSHDKFFLKTEGVMHTHDEETKKFFKHSSVNCVLSPRYAYASSKLSIFKQQVVGTLFTHHQKCVIVDSQGPGNHRKITTFIGGLDLCDGRYDTPEHRLYKDLDTVFKNDYHNPTFSGADKGPRQPWHDWHCKIEGPAAYDVLKNFEQRWRKASRWSEFGRRFKRITHWHDDAMIKLERISWIISPSKTVSADDPLLWVSKENDPENWHVQVFRSIDSGSVKGFPKDVQEAEAQNLVCAKNLVIDMSIHTAYVQAIRSAQHFIYIENQYFVGSSYAWSSNQDAGADNLIPMEVALKIASKIRAKERFAVYVIIPMWPEGVPSSAAVQEILFWQTQTMQMMYEIITKELKYMNLENAHPRDYLNFYCLGNREEPPPEELGSADNSASASEKFRRFMIYVHTKGMIVDDEYVLLGSANINQRSLDGSRDTEIAMGAYQPHYTWAKNRSHPHGQVYGYRMSLWAEHTGIVNDIFKEPQDLDCVKAVNSIAEENWSKFSSEEFRPLDGHLLKYPIEVDVNGNIEAIPGQETFPDVGGKVMGARTNLPNALTT